MPQAVAGPFPAEAVAAQQLPQPVGGDLHPALLVQPLAQRRDGPGDAGRRGPVQQSGQRGTIVAAQHLRRAARPRGIGQRPDPAVFEAAGRRANGDHVAFEQVGHLGGGPAPVEQADALRPQSRIAGQIPPRQQFVQLSPLIVSQLDTEDVRHDVPPTGRLPNRSRLHQIRLGARHRRSGPLRTTSTGGA